MAESAKKILYIEDNTDTMALVVDILEVSGYAALTALDGDIGLQRIREDHPDLILCDINLPRMRGYEVLAEVHKDPQLVDIPFIFLTAMIEPDDIRKGLALGAVDYICKPFNPHDMLLRIETALSRQAVRVSATQPAKAPPNHHIFLSYSRQDDPIMRRVLDNLRAENLQVWMDDQLEPGERSWKKAIQEAIDKAGCLVAILSPDAKQSQWVEAELDYAEAQNKAIYPVLAKGDRSNAVPFGYTLSQWIDIANKDFDAEMKRLVTAIRKQLNIS